ncbi:hypothetical protein KX75_20330 [Salmonella enterica subsp. enterica]|nr:hypothetical protein [Salmonella enterica subsp. enterica serovar Mikawasima]EDN7229220.1 hypothetical protein [Salmonella enterica subsp. enterica serovar Mikawasima]
MDEREAVKNLLQYLTDHSLVSCDEFAEVMKIFNITTTWISDEMTGQWAGALGKKGRFLVDVYSPLNPGGERFEFDSPQEAAQFSALQRRIGDPGFKQ